MYEFVAGDWLFQPRSKSDLSRDVIHLAQMTLRTGQEHDEAAFEKYKGEEGQKDIKGIAP